MSSILSFISLGGLTLVSFSVLLGLRRTSLFISWLALELNLISFIIWILRRKEEASLIIKYFLVQRIGSIIFLLRILLFMFSEFSLFLIYFSLVLKLGFAPAHVWVVNILPKFSNLTIVLLISVQKILPLFILLRITQIWILYFVFISGLAVGLVGALHQVCWKKIIAYSSIFSGSWLLLGACAIYSSYFFLMIYTLGILLILLRQGHVNNRIVLNLKLSKVSVCGFSAGLLRIAGIPPLVGFFGKIILVLESFKAFSEFIIALIIILSIFIVYVYIRLFYNTLTSRLSSYLLNNETRFSTRVLVIIILGGVIWAYVCECKHVKFWS